MIQINHISGGYGTNVLFENTSLILYPNSINGIIGKSGIGKSTILNVIGLINFDISFDYQWHNQNFNHLSKNQIADIRRTEIGYFLQEKSLISDKLRLIDNIQCMYALVSRKYDSSQIKQLLELLKLTKIDLNRYPKSLSGGERQRFALLLTLLKKPKLLLCDEPTSALDYHNTSLFLDILRNLSNQGVIIVVASHDEFVIQNMDNVYEIKDRKFNLIKTRIEDDRSNFRIKHKRKVDKNFFKYYNKRARDKYLYIFYTILIMMLSLLTILPNLLSNQKSAFLNQLDDVSNKEIFVVNTTDSIPNPQYLDNVATFTNDDIEMLNNFKHIEKVVPFYQLIIDPKTININGYPLSSVKNQEEYYIQPYIGNNTFIAYGAAHMLHVKSGDTLVMAVTTDFNPETYFPIDIDNIQVQNEGKHNPYSAIQNVIYVPYQELEKQIPINQIHEMRKALLVEVDSIENIEEIMNKITMWLPNASLLYNLGNVQMQLEVIDTLENYLTIFFLISTGIGIIFITWNEIFLMKKRMHDISFLIMNGFLKKDIYKIIKYEKIKESGILCIGILLVSVMSFVFRFSYKMVSILIIYYLFMAFLYILLSSTIAFFVIKKHIREDNIAKGLTE